MSKHVIEPILITHPEQRRSSEQDVELLARLMDSAFEIPGVGVRFGLDSIIGLFPGIGDIITSFASIYILKVAAGCRVPRVVLLHMTSNLAIDYIVGSLPVVGDLFDVYWKANLKNVKLLQRHLEATPAVSRHGSPGDWLFVGGLIAGLIALLVGCTTIAYFLVTSMWRILAG